MRNIIFKYDSSFGDTVVFTAAIRDLHKCYPDQFRTAVHTRFPMLWENNPYISELDATGSGVEVVPCELPSVRERNNLAYHAIHGFINLLNHRLGLHIQPTTFKGDIHLSDEDKSWVSQVAEITGGEIPFWVLVAGADRDCTVKSWGTRKFQQVIDHFKNRIQFVQVGDIEHPALKGVIDLRGQTDLRQLVRLIYHSQGVLCPSIVHMHLAAAVETKPGGPTNRPCVVVAGGRESVYWQAYAHHQYIHTIGMLPCCFNGGCWKSRTVPLLDGSEYDRQENLCVDVVRKSPRCMDMIAPSEVIRRVEIYFRAEQLPTLSPKQTLIVSEALSFGNRINREGVRLETTVLRRGSEDHVKQIPPYPKRFRNRGIVISAGDRYLPCAWVCIRMLRKLGCHLPIELWYLGREEMEEQFEQLVKPFNVQCIDGLQMNEKHPARKLAGRHLKAYAIKHSQFEEVLLLDADNVPVVNPEFLFDMSPYDQTGAIFWPDDCPRIEPEVWNIFGAPYVKEPEFASGQIVVHKRKCWRALCLALWYSEHTDFYCRYALRDEDVFHLAFRKLGKAFSFIEPPAERLQGTMCQHDFAGRRIFQHRNQHKWRLAQDNPHVPGFLYEKECRRFLDELRLKWLTPPPLLIVPDTSKRTEQAHRYFDELTGSTYEYQRKGYDARRMSFNSNGTIGFGSAELEKHWHITHLRGQTWLEILSDEQVICRLKPHASGNWRGRWNYHEKMLIKLTRETFQAINLTSDHEPPCDAQHRILFRAPLNGYTGYGLHANQIVTDLQAMGYDFFIRAIDINETFAPIPENVRKSIVCHEHPSEWELVLCPPGFIPLAGKKTVHFTMWESTKLHANTISNFNRCECVIVPTQWNASCFYSSGVERPIYIVPLGIKTEIFKYASMDMQGPCTFGTAGRLESGGTRKGINLVIDSFRKAFPTQKDVCLYVKIFPDCDVPAEADPRIKFNREYFSEKQMAAWFQRLICFVSGARGEGWGLMQHQALATGRPIISVRFGGTAEFFTEHMGYPLDFQLVPAEDLYTGCGLWADPDEKHLVQLMRQVYKNREQARELGLNAARLASKYSWLESSKKLRQVLQKVGMIN